MIRKYVFGVCALVLTLTLFSSSAIASEPEVVVTNNGLALLLGETDVEIGSPVIMQIVPEGEGVLTSDSNINGYINETVVGRDGKYKLLFSLEDIYEPETRYECHVDVAGKEYFLVQVAQGSLIEISLKSFDRDTKTITVTGSLWDSGAYGIDLTLTINDFVKTVHSSDDGSFTFEFTMSEAGITEYGNYNFTIAYSDDESSYCEDSIELVSADPILEDIKLNAENGTELEKILTDTQKLNILGFTSDVLYGDCELTKLAGSEFFKKLAKSDVKADTVSDLETSIKTAYALYNMEKNPSDINLRRCIDLFSLAADDEITLIYDSFNSEDEQKYLFELWKKTDFTNTAQACEFYKEAVIRTKLNTAEAWSGLMLFVNNNNTLLGVEKQTSADFWQKLINKSPFSSLEDFKTKYKQALNSKDDRPSGGGGGGGSSSRPGVSVNPVTGNQTPGQPKPSETKTVFKDISGNHWALEAITKLYEMGIVSGKDENTFAPDDLVTRAEVAKLMCVSAKLNEAEAGNATFSDVDNNHWAIGYIEAAFKNGLVNGRGDGYFAPSDCTTREDMAVFCYRLLKKIKPENADTVYTKDDLTFADSEKIADYAVEAVAAMVKLGIISGKDNNVFDPKAYCTRAEAAKIFYGVLQ